MASTASRKGGRRQRGALIRVSQLVREEEQHDVQPVYTPATAQADCQGQWILTSQALARCTSNAEML